MLSTFPPTFSSDTFIGNHQSPLFDTGFPLWEYHEPSFLFAPLSPQQQEPPVIFTPPSSQEPGSPNPGSGTSIPAQGPGSNETNPSGSKNDITPRNNSKNSSDDDERERRRKRMISNRESARRSRMRKVKHLENLRSKANRLKVGNRDLMNRLRLLVQHGQFVRAENECLRSEAVMLRRRLCDIRQFLLLRQLQQQLKPSAWPCTNNPTSINQGQLINY